MTRALPQPRKRVSLREGGTLATSVTAASFSTTAAKDMRVPRYWNARKAQKSCTSESDPQGSAIIPEPLAALSETVLRRPFHNVQPPYANRAAASIMLRFRAYAASVAGIPLDIKAIGDSCSTPPQNVCLLFQRAQICHTSIGTHLEASKPSIRRNPASPQLERRETWLCLLSR